MSWSATLPARASRSAETVTFLLIIWAATVASSLIASLGGGESLSTDDAMRLVEVRDLMAGQSWFDLTQYRLAPPEGVVMHWSRLIDLPLAALIGAGEWVMSPAAAERVATTVWPVALLLVFLAGVAALARELADGTAARLAPVFAAITAPLLQHFRPGAIDHHNAQLALLVWSLALGVQPAARPAATAGVLCALSLAIGQEMAPAIAALAAAVALRWIVQGEPVRPATTAFALAFALATAALFAASVAPAHYADAACDALSVAQVLPVGIGGAGLAVLASMAAMNTPGRRLAGALGIGATIAATMVFAFPACLADPYAHLDPRLSQLWLSNVSEARSIVTLWRDLPQEVLPYYGLAMTAFALGLYRSWREQGERRWRWIMAAMVLLPLIVVALWQVRGCAAANTIAVALTPAALVRGFPARDGRAVFLGLGRAALIAAACLNPLTLIVLGNAGARTADAVTGATPPTVIADGPGTCRRAADYVPLARLPRGLVLAFIDSGPFLLLQTPHTVLAAPYHRNVRGNAAMLDTFLAAPGEAKAQLTALGVDYVAFCPGAPERYNYARSAPQGLVALLTRGEAPPYLDRIPLAGTELAVYRVRR
jgi:hypothetical protein